MSTASAKAAFSRIAAKLVIATDDDPPAPSPRPTTPPISELAVVGLLQPPQPANSHAELEKLGLVTMKRPAVLPARRLV